MLSYVIIFKKCQQILKKRTYFVSSEQKITYESFYIEDNLQVARQILQDGRNEYNQISCIHSGRSTGFLSELNEIESELFGYVVLCLVSRINKAIKCTVMTSSKTSADTNDIFLSDVCLRYCKV